MTAKTARIAKTDSQTHSLRISNVEQLTDNSICVSFDIPKELKETYRFLPGQYLTLQAQIDAEEIRRSYSICSGPNDAALNSTLRVGIKRVEDGVFSNYANDEYKAGASVDVMPPQGNFYAKTDPAHSKNYMCIAVGSGITPILAITKAVLEEEPNSVVTMIYGNRNTGTMMFREALLFLKNRFMGRFQWINMMGKEEQGSDLFKGHIDNKCGYLLQKHRLIDIKSVDEAFMCGPESMMTEVSRGFRMEGLTDDQINYELFASSAEAAREALAKARQRVAKFGETKTSSVTLVADGRSVEFDLAMVGENILDAGLHHGMELPYSCKAGVCSTCKCRVTSGAVEMDISHGLEPNEIEDGLVLSCQAHPISDEVTLDFDQR